MRRKAIAVAVAAALLCLGGCAALSKPTPPPAMQFSYTANNGPAAGLVRAFILNGSTVLQFIDIGQADPKVYVAGQAAPLPYQVVGQYAILSGIHPSLRIVANDATATVIAASLQDSPPAPAAPTAAPSSALSPVAMIAGEPLPIPAASRPDPLAVQLQEALRQLAQARKDLDDLKREFAGSSSANGVGIRPAALIVPAAITPAAEQPRTWTLAGNRSLKDNLADMAREAGYAEPNWRAANPYLVTYTTKYTGTFLEVVGKIAEQVPALDFRVYSWKRTIEVAEATN